MNLYTMIIVISFIEDFSCLSQAQKNTSGIYLFIYL